MQGAAVNRREANNADELARWSQRSSGAVRACGFDDGVCVRERGREQASREAFTTAHGNTANRIAVRTISAHHNPRC